MRNLPPQCWYPKNRKQPPGKILVRSAWSSFQPIWGWNCSPLHKIPFLSRPSLCHGDPSPAASVTSQLSSAAFPVLLSTMREDTKLQSFSQSAFHPVVFIKQIISCPVIFSDHSLLPTTLFLHTPSIPACPTASSDSGSRPVKWEASWHEPHERKVTGRT